MKLKVLLSAVLLFGVGHMVHAQDGSKPALPVGQSKFDYEKPLFKFKEEQLSNTNGLLRYVAMTGYREGVLPFKGQFGVNFNGYNDTVTNSRRICMYNLSVTDLLSHGLISPSQILLVVKGPSRYRYDPEYGDEVEWLRKNGYCFEMLLPLGALKDMSSIDNEIKRIFDVSAGWEERSVRTLVLVRTSAVDKLKSAGGEPLKDHAHGIYRNVNIGWVGDPLNKQGFLPFLDETGYKEPVDLNLGISIDTDTSIPDLRKALQKYDLDLKEELRKRQMFVITENKK